MGLYESVSCQFFYLRIVLPLSCLAHYHVNLSCLSKFYESLRFRAQVKRERECKCLSQIGRLDFLSIYLLMEPSIINPSAHVHKQSHQQRNTKLKASFRLVRKLRPPTRAIHFGLFSPQSQWALFRPPCFVKHEPKVHHGGFTY